MDSSILEFFKNYALIIEFIKTIERKINFKH